MVHCFLKGEKKVDGRIVALSAAVLFGVAFIAGMVVYGRFMRLNDRISGLRKQVEQLTAENQELKVENDELESTVQLLSSAVYTQTQNEKERQSKEAELSLPTDFPVTGTVSMLEVTKKQIEEKQAEAASAPEGTEVEQLASDKPIMIFTAQEGSSVIASGGGKVVSIEEDELYGKVISIDHGNGYVTMYRNGGASKVEVGESVTRGTVLYVVGSGNRIIGFQIQYNGEYIDPKDVVEIAG